MWLCCQERELKIRNLIFFFFADILTVGNHKVEFQFKRNYGIFGLYFVKSMLGVRPFEDVGPGTTKFDE